MHTWISLNPEYDYHYFNDSMAEDWILDNHDDPAVLKTYLSIHPTLGAAKADLFRYAYLAKVGGIYADIDTMDMVSFQDIIDCSSLPHKGIM